ncbi:MAG: hypothetical protein LBC95_02010 [Candidatus Nomurabacteria bacterium]|jgi:DNA polymerase I-like protein with 3'-5' exonuclease and polymerase domains/5'-3' exonuclease|nr:hypothetical protein [Candidatus Nomurabacteria bacterium]
MTKKLAIIDGKSVFYRGFYAMSNLTTSDGTAVGGVYGFAAMAIELMRKFQPDYVAVAWDKQGTNIRRRKQIYPAYKAGRKPAPPEFYTQVPILHELLEAFHWPLYEADDFEADDIIGTLARAADDAGGLDTLMITSDLDMLQIVDHNTRLFALKKGFTDIEEFDVAALEQKYGIKKQQFLDLKAIKGDSSDNIPGVPGIGEKTAVQLLRQYDDLDGIYAHLDEIKPAWRNKLADGRELAYTSRSLGEIQFDAPVRLDLPAMDVRGVDPEKLRAALMKLEFRSLLRRLPDFMRSNAPLEILPEQTEIEKIKNSQNSDFIKKLDLDLEPLLRKIEARGVMIDVAGLGKLSQVLAQRISAIEREIWDLVGEQFNISSPAQLSVILFERLQLSTAGIKRNKSGYSTGKSELDKLRGAHPIIEKISEIRELLKMKNTYVDALPKLVDRDSRLHTTFSQTVTATGRLSSSNPNLQNIPIRTELGQEIRQYFVASPGKLLISADYSQFELRLAAALAGDKQLIADFDDDRIDIHTKTAAEAYKVPVDAVTPEQRRNAKVINFGVLYGMSPHGLAAATGMSFSAAKDFIEKYFAARQPIRDFLATTIKKAETDGYVETYFGRRRQTPDVRAANFVIREAAKRAAANMPIQGTEADLMKMAMLKIEAELGERAPQILQIHDSIMVECNPADAPQISAEMKRIMENIYPKIGVKLRVDIKSGANWGEL